MTPPCALCRDAPRPCAYHQGVRDGKNASKPAPAASGDGEEMRLLLELETFVRSRMSTAGTIRLNDVLARLDAARRGK